MDLNILELDFNTLSQLETILENRSTRETFLQAVPQDYFDHVSVQLLDNEAYRNRMTTARWLLFRLGRHDARVSDFISWLEKVNLERALILLSRDVPLEIVEQPPPMVEVETGAKLLVSCKASSYPPGEYQWFKGDEEQLLQQDPELTILSIKKEDAGIYVCLITKRNLETKDVSWIYSNPVEVIVLEAPIGIPPISGNFNQFSRTDANCLPSREIVSLNSDQLPQQIAYEDSEVSADITIEKQPCGKGKVAQGMSVCLICKAKSISGRQIKYQWYKNGRPLSGAICRKLQLNNLYTDADTGDMRWEYFCEISNELDKAFTQTAIVELEKADDTTRYEASGKYAFMVANDKYEKLEGLRKPANDVADLGKLLESMKFNVDAYRNLSQTEMKNAFSLFCRILKPNCYILFYFAGHGFDQYGQSYLLPVDCSYDYTPQEAICTEYILQCMQEAKPALNILLIDACRKLPPLFWNESKPAAPQEIFYAKMKNNTLYGYSTPSLYSSHEGSAEHNSFFVKYLKKYITHNKCIQDILLQVQRDFEGDPCVKGVQFPEIKTSLSGFRKLCDEIQESDVPSENVVTLADIKGSFDLLPEEIKLLAFKSAIFLEINSHMDIFVNGIDITVSIDVTVESFLVIVRELEIDIVSNMPDVQVLPPSGVYLKNLDLKPNTRNMLFRKQILGIHKIKNKKLEGKVVLKLHKLEMEQETEFSINIQKITDMNLSINYLGSKDTEEEIYSNENNVSSCSSENPG